MHKLYNRCHSKVVRGVTFLRFACLTTKPLPPTVWLITVMNYSSLSVFVPPPLPYGTQVGAPIKIVLTVRLYKRNNSRTDKRIFTEFSNGKF
jgi:hypothetical protein